MAEDYGVSDAALEQRIAEMSDDDLEAVLARTRPPRLPKGNHVPGIGSSPTDPRVAERAQIAASEAAGDWQTSFAQKSQMLNRLMRKEK
jgi:hypothetical protein